MSGYLWIQPAGLPGVIHELGSLDDVADIIATYDLPADNDRLLEQESSSAVGITILQYLPSDLPEGVQIINTSSGE